MHLSSSTAKISQPVRLALSAAVCAALALTARAESRVGLDLNLHLGPPAPIIVREAPPRPVIVERQYATPGPGFVWIAGHNSWINGRWVWVSGTWARPPQAGAFYVEGRWNERSRNWIEAHWEVVAPPPPPAGLEFSINSPPPPPRHEVILARPSPHHVWIDGYWVRHDHRQEWVAGHWELPPHGHHEWVAPRWEHRGGAYVFIEGRWR